MTKFATKPPTTQSAKEAVELFTKVWRAKVVGFCVLLFKWNYRQSQLHQTMLVLPFSTVTGRTFTWNWYGIIIRNNLKKKKERENPFVNSAFPFLMCCLFIFVQGMLDHAEKDAKHVMKLRPDWMKGHLRMIRIMVRQHKVSECLKKNATVHKKKKTLACQQA